MNGEAPMQRTGAVLVAHDLWKAFGATQALAGVSLEVRPNEILGLVGENGAGKSTLLKVLSGGVPADRGELWLRGAPVQLSSVREAARLGIGMVAQEQSLLPNLSVAENIFLGNESGFVRFGILDWRRLREAARARLLYVGSSADPRAITGTLSFGERQSVELARVMALRHRDDGQALILLDEPTSMLQRGEVERLFELVREMRRSASVIFVSHRLDEALEITDRVYVLRDGRVAATLETKSTDVRQLQRHMVGRDLHLEYYQEGLQTGAGEDRVLAVNGLALKGVFSDVSLDLHRGEILGLCGVLGSGCEAVVRTLAGIHRPTSGSVALHGTPWDCSNPEGAIARGIGYVPSERGREGLIPPLPVAHNITLPHLEAICEGGLLRPRKERNIADSWIRQLRIRCGGPDVPALSLSGGNQQKVVLAKWLAARVQLLILDHPTRGIDVGAKEEVYRLIRELTAQGLSILLVPDTLEEGIGLSDKILCMRDGAVTAMVPAPRGAKPTPLGILSNIV